ncbi:hypothetical protein ACFC0K_15805 [Streptomyces hydrogenans]|uniref:hypothetical protein n=1 Tax=Streptomyces hydrogenans TaxID=1873719 RepID=UPI0035D6516A
MPETIHVEALRALADHQGGTYAQRRALHLAAVRRYVAKLPFGAKLPTLTEIAADLCTSVAYIAAALRTMDLLGEVVHGNKGYRYRLRPQEQHPMDVAIDKAVREGIWDGTHQSGTALPVGILAQRHGLAIEMIPRAMRALIRDGLVADREGPAGRGYYVRDPQDAVLDRIRLSP